MARNHEQRLALIEQLLVEDAGDKSDEELLETMRHALANLGRGGRLGEVDRGQYSETRTSADGDSQLASLSDAEVMQQLETARAEVRRRAAEGTPVRREATQPEPEEVHPVDLADDAEDAASAEQVAAVAAVLAEPDPRKRWQMEQALSMAEAVRVATEEGQRQAERDYDLGRHTPSQTIGAGELVDLLMQQRRQS